MKLFGLYITTLRKRREESEMDNAFLDSHKRLHDKNAKLEEEIYRLREIEDKYIRLTDRDEKGRFKK